MSVPFKKAAECGNNLMVVDALNLAFRFKHAGDTDFRDDYLDLINSLKKSYKAKYVIIAADKGSSSYRKELYPDYKQDRRDKAEKQTEEEKEAFILFFQEYEEALQNIRENTEYPLLQYNKVEADDIAAYIAGCNLPVEHTWLISSDKDWDLLLSDKVSRFSYVTRKDYTVDNWGDRYNFSIEDYISIKCLVGGKDNVVGVKGIGSVKAEHLVATYGSVLDIVDSLPIAGTYKYIEALNKARDLLMLNYNLVDLKTFCADAIGATNVRDMRIKIENYLNCEL